MKKLILTAMAVFTLTMVNAQEEGSGFAKSDIFISGSFGIASESQGDASTTGFGIAPRIGYFVSENIAIGLQLGYASTSFDSGVDGVDEIKNTGFDAGLFGRYLFTPASKFTVFAELGFGIGNTKAEQGSVDLGKFNSFGLAVSPGISYFLSNNFAIEASWGALSYDSEKADVDGADANNTINFGLDLDDINLGLLYKF